MSTTNAHAFIEKLKEESFFIDLLPFLAVVPDGDWDAVVRIAGEAGYEFTAEELKQVAPAGFFKGAGQDPEQGWDRSTLE